ncbi:MAG: methionyl-tRNA formyltransferase [Ferrovum sp. 37-45-19]|nr:MAG: methionyl-tRNA formyltransferase [Ferrovum sp. 21-44-67]OYV94382.1 MAG: methionyl-tRNA formyltransferase [Ferrovum sp. 37-45-19]OZB33242.1 MAG: methionyl-tRNA formyltransferase [Ferrovum sp. 34-44-207]HQT80645.1 methionyl-tRNA formyltransferase [Ferrovaceae bacterium]HQU06750.1 methionyl-tRNA formyltransferase [Ferrovaceae bacterium]
MRVVIIGQQDFGKGVLDAFLGRGDEVLGVFCAPEKEGTKADSLRLAAQNNSIPVYQFASLKSEEATMTMRRLYPDLGIMAYVVQFAPPDFVSIPQHGTIQYHPSLLPKHRGPSSINWAIINGDKETGFTIFRPTDGLDEGPIILQQHVAIGDHDTVGSLYFNALFPLGVAAMVEAADLIFEGRHKEVIQDEGEASYEGWCRTMEARINWYSHVDYLYNLIRGCNPAPGAWTLLGDKKIQLFDVKKQVFRTFGAVHGRIGEITEVGPVSFKITAQGGYIEVFKLKHEEGKKITANEFIKTYAIQEGMVMNS